jgi:hypothetical protein
MIIIMTLVYALFLFLDFIPVYRGNSRKLIWLYLSLLIFSYSLTFLIGLGVKIPSPAPPIKKVITSLIGGK